MQNSEEGPQILVRFKKYFENQWGSNADGKILGLGDPF